MSLKIEHRPCSMLILYELFAAVFIALYDSVVQLQKYDFSVISDIWFDYVFYLIMPKMVYDYIIGQGRALRLPFFLFRWYIIPTSKAPIEREAGVSFEILAS